jgi:hypothetical protein
MIDNVEKKQKIKDDLESIWENDIMTNFSAHWDYKNHCPKRKIAINIDSLSYRTPNARNSILSKVNFANCFRKKRSENSQNLQENLNPDDSSIYTDDQTEYVASRGFFLE